MHGECTRLPGRPRQLPAALWQESTWQELGSQPATVTREDIQVWSCRMHPAFRPPSRERPGGTTVGQGPAAAASPAGLPGLWLRRPCSACPARWSQALNHLLAGGPSLWTRVLAGLPSRGTLQPCSCCARTRSIQSGDGATSAAEATSRSRGSFHGLGACWAREPGTPRG